MLKTIKEFFTPRKELPEEYKRMLYSEFNQLNSRVAAVEEYYNKHKSLPTLEEINNVI